MCRSISQHRLAVQRSVRAVAEVDVVRAKAKMGERLKGIIPEVQVSIGGMYIIYILIYIYI